MKRPYLAHILLRLVPVELPGLGTLAVDRYGRLYFDPAVVETWRVEGLAGVITHEADHLLRRRHERLAGYPQRAAWAGADAEINDDLLREREELPGYPITSDMLGLPEGLAAEQYIALLLQRQQEQQEGDSGSSEGGQDSSRSGENTEGSSQQEDPCGEEEGNDSSGEDSSREGSPDGGSSNGGSSREEASQGDSPRENSSDGGSSRGGSSEEDGCGDTEARQGGSCGDGGSSQEEGRFCRGSAATGRPEPWELGQEEAPSISRLEMEIIRRQTGEAILRTVRKKEQGSVPGGWIRWAEEIGQPPRIPWQQKLARVLRWLVSARASMVDYSYRRLSRRQSAVPDVVLPGMVRPTPELAVVVDTSGSMEEREISLALREIRGILQATRSGTTVLAVDAAVQTCRRVFNPRQVLSGLHGGGGTDMRVGLEAALRLKPRPDIVVVITDGWTPWPSSAPPVPVMVVTTDREGPPWAETVLVRG
jgi:predicted metal-dependent peptidase